MSCDVLIIGAGIAGLTAALNAKDENNNVIVVSKNYPTYSQSCQAQGGINAVLKLDESKIKLHIDDTYNASRNLANKDNIKDMCLNASKYIKWLDDLGVPFNRNESNQISQRKFGGTKEKRTCYSSDYTGLKIINTLYDECLNKGIEFYYDYFLLDLLVYENKCYGGKFYNISNGDINDIYASSTILATGGYAGVYFNHTTNSYTNTSEAIYIAYKNGVKLSNMEFVQFHPTTLVNSNILISESCRGEGAYLVDEEFNRFIDELETRDKITKKIYEMKLENKKVFLDLRHLGEVIDELLPQEKDIAFCYANIDIKKELLQIEPASHYSMGGIKTDSNTKTNINSLYACGECSQMDIHGANRLGGNSLLELIHSGTIAGKNAKSNKKFIINHYSKKSNIFDIEYLLSLPNKLNFYKYKIDLGRVMFKYAGIKRDKNSLNKALRFIEEAIKDINQMGVIDKSKKYNKNLIEFIEFISMVHICKCIVLNALNRCESRGSHFREDYKDELNEYKLNSFIIYNNNDYFGFEDLK